MADMDGELTARPTYTIRALPPGSARYHAEILRAAADLLLAGEPVWWMQPEYEGNKRGITYLFDADPCGQRRWRCGTASRPATRTM